MNRDKVDPNLALTWENIEQRRCLAEIIGWARILERLDAHVVQSDHRGQLLEADLPDSPGQRFARVTCGTGRTFVLLVGREHKTCAEAVARTYRVPTEVYERLQART